jgi:hypothetical protein
VRLAAAVLAIVPLIGVAAVRHVDERFGLTATYYAGTDWTGPVRHTGIDSVVSTATVRQHVPDMETQSFSVEWNGYIAAPQASDYRVAIESDDGAWVWLDDTLVLDNGGRHGKARVEAIVRLSREPQRIRIRYVQFSGKGACNLLWGRRSTGALHVIPPTSLLREDVPLTTFERFVLAHRSDVFRSAGLWMMAAALLLFPAAGRHVALIAPGDSRAHAVHLAVLGLFALTLAMAGISWGLPSDRGWAPDELSPGDVLRGIEARLANGWWDKYPPLPG